MKDCHSCLSWVRYRDPDSMSTFGISSYNTLYASYTRCLSLPCPQQYPQFQILLEHKTHAGLPSLTNFRCSLIPFIFPICVSCISKDRFNTVTSCPIGGLSGCSVFGVPQSLIACPSSPLGRTAERAPRGHTTASVCN